jgi:hypothetical protein
MVDAKPSAGLTNYKRLTNLWLHTMGFLVLAIPIARPSQCNLRFVRTGNTRWLAQITDFHCRIIHLLTTCTLPLLGPTPWPNTLFSNDLQFALVPEINLSQVTTVHSNWSTLYASCCVSWRICFEAVYTTVKFRTWTRWTLTCQHYFILLLMTSVHISTLIRVILRRTWIVGVSFWIASFAQYEFILYLYCYAGIIIRFVVQNLI